MGRHKHIFVQAVVCLQLLSLSLYTYGEPCGKSAITPLQNGLLQAKTGEERYKVLYETHQKANEKGLTVDYKGLDTIRLTIPAWAEPISIKKDCNFHGVVFVVENKTKELYLFSIRNEAKAVEVPAANIDNGDFDGCKELCDGEKILVVEDQKPWVANRKGYTYGHIRKDVLLLKGGHSKNKPIMPYNNENSQPVCRYYDVNAHRICFSNMVLNRTESSTSRTYLLDVKGSKVELRDVVINTPRSDMVNDQAIFIAESADVRFKNVTINGTYCRRNHSGYGILMDAVYDVSFDNLIGDADWGIFGNNNINRARLQNCDINRFDIHCYGKDVTFKKCKFRNLYNQFSSVYGKVLFDSCEFFDFVPFLFESSYNAYTAFDLTFKECSVHANKERNYLIDGGALNGEKTTERPELRKQEYPRLVIDGLKLIMDDGSETYYIYKFQRKLLQWPQDNVPGLKRIKKIEFTPEKKQKVVLSNREAIVRYPESEYVPYVIGVGGLSCAGVFILCLNKRRNKREKV